MRHERLHALTDGIFAIAMTLLVFAVKVPVVQGMATNANLWHVLREDWILIFSYILSFTVLFTYWRAHTFIITIAAKNIDVWLANINGLFLLWIALLPFSAQMLGTYHKTQVGVAIYALNVILIGASLYIMRRYVEDSASIEMERVTPDEHYNSRVRIFLPILIAAISIGVSFVSTTAAVLFLALAVIFNLLPSHSILVRPLLRKT